MSRKKACRQGQVSAHWWMSGVQDCGMPGLLLQMAKRRWGRASANIQKVDLSSSPPTVAPLVVSGVGTRALWPFLSLVYTSFFFLSSKLASGALTASAKVSGAAQLAWAGQRGQVRCSLSQQRCKVLLASCFHLWGEGFKWDVRQLSRERPPTCPPYPAKAGQSSASCEPESYMYGTDQSSCIVRAQSLRLGLAV